MAAQAPRLIGPHHPFPMLWIERALALYRDLTADGGEQVLLHGDLHHGNILAAERAAWLAIDPKGVVGEPVWETRKHKNTQTRILFSRGWLHRVHKQGVRNHEQTL